MKGPGVVVFVVFASTVAIPVAIRVGFDVAAVFVVVATCRLGGSGTCEGRSKVGCDLCPNTRSWVWCCGP